MYKRLMRNSLVVMMCCSVNIFATNGDKVVAKYSGGNVTAGSVMEYFKDSLDASPELKGKSFDTLPGNLQEALVKGYINSQLINKAVQDSGISNTQEFKKEIDNLTKQYAQQKFVKQYVGSKVTDQIVRDEYDRMQKEYANKKEAKLSHIVVDSEAEAKKVKAEAAKTNFAKLAKKYSKDEGTKSSGGSIGYVIQGSNLPAEIDAVVFSTKQGDVTDPIEIQGKYHVFKVEEVRKAVLPKFDDVSQQIRSNLEQKAFADFAKEEYGKANVIMMIDSKATSEKNSKEPQDSKQ